MTLNIIHLARRSDRYNHLIEELANQNISDYVIWDGVEGKIPKQNISRAFKRVVQHYKSINAPFVCLAEDDLKFTSPNSWEYFLANIPPQYDIYTASYYSGSHDENFEVKGFRGMTLVIVAERYYDTFLSLTEVQHIDGAIAMSNAKVISCYPFAAIQTPGFSDQRKRMADDSYRLKGKQLFGQ